MRLLKLTSVFLCCLMTAGCTTIPPDTPALLKAKDEMAASDLSALTQYISTYESRRQKAQEAFVQIEQLADQLQTDPNRIDEQIDALTRYARIGKSATGEMSDAVKHAKAAEERLVRFNYASDKLHDIIFYAVDKEWAMSQAMADLKLVLGIHPSQTTPTSKGGSQ